MEWVNACRQMPYNLRCHYIKIDIDLTFEPMFHSYVKKQVQSSAHLTVLSACMHRSKRNYVVTVYITS